MSISNVSIDLRKLGITWAKDTDYTISFDQGFTKESSNNRALSDTQTNVLNADSSTFVHTFATDPSLVSVSPASSSTNLVSPTVKLTYDRIVYPNTGTFTLNTISTGTFYTIASTDTRITTDPTGISINLTNNPRIFQGGEEFYINFTEGTIDDIFNFKAPAVTDNSTIKYTYRPSPVITSVTPAYGSSGAFVNTVSATFDRTILKNINNVKLYRSGNLVSTIPASSSTVISSGTTLTIGLAQQDIYEGGEEYYVTLDYDIVKDLDNLPFRGVDNNTVIKFTQLPNPSTLSTIPVNNATNIVSPTIYIRTDRTLQKGISGNIKLYSVKPSGDVEKLTIPVADSRVTTSSTWVIVNLSAADALFDSGRIHYLTIDKGAILDTNKLPFVFNNSNLQFQYFFRVNPFPIVLSSNANPYNKLSLPLTYTVTQSTGTEINGLLTIRRNGVAVSTSSWNLQNTATITVSPAAFTTSTSLSMQVVWDSASSENGDKLWASTSSNIVTQLINGSITVTADSPNNVLTSSTSFTVTADTSNPAPATISLYRNTTLISTVNTTTNQVKISTDALPVGTSTMRVIWNTSYAVTATNTTLQTIYNKNTNAVTISNPSTYSYYLPNGSVNTGSLVVTSNVSTNGVWGPAQGVLGIYEGDTSLSSITISTTGTYNLNVGFSAGDIGTSKTIYSKYLGNGFNSPATSTTSTVSIKKNIPLFNFTFNKSSLFSGEILTITATTTTILADPVVTFIDDTSNTFLGTATVVAGKATLTYNPVSGGSTTNISIKVESNEDSKNELGSNISNYLPLRPMLPTLWGYYSNSTATSTISVAAVVGDNAPLASIFRPPANSGYVYNTTRPEIGGTLTLTLPDSAGVTINGKTLVADNDNQKLTSRVYYTARDSIPSSPIYSKGLIVKSIPVVNGIATSTNVTYAEIKAAVLANTWTYDSNGNQISLGSVTSISGRLEWMYESDGYYSGWDFVNGVYRGTNNDLRLIPSNNWSQYPIPYTNNGNYIMISI